MLAILAAGAVLPARAAEKESWAVQDGWVSLELEASRLLDYGVEIYNRDSGVQSSDIEPLSFFVAGVAGNELSMPKESAFSHPRGLLAFDADLVIVGPRGSLRIPSAVLDVASGDPSAPLAVGGIVDGVFAPLLELAAERRAFDRAAGAFLFESEDVRLSDWAIARIGAAELSGVSIGLVRGRINGDLPAASLAGVDPLNGDSSVVAGGNNGTVCPTPVGPDVIVGELYNVANYTAVGGIEAFTIGTISCNIGNQNLSWISNNNQHPVISQNMFKLKNGRFEHIGQAWLKHGFTALTNNDCGCGCNGVGGSQLGVGCSDPYSAGLNGQQGGMGPKFQVNAWTGFFPYPYAGQGQTGNDIYKRIQVAISDLEAAGSGSSTHYYIEGHYVAPDDSAHGNQDNNASYRRVFMSGSGSAWSISLAGTTVRERPAIRAWKAADPAVQETEFRVPNEGLFILAAKATDLGNGNWHYEYAIQNLNSDRSGASFRVPLGTGAVVQNIGFRDVAYHSGEPYDGTDWSAVVGGGAITWSTVPYSVNQNANALRWATLYNFRFECNAPPSTVMATIGLFKPGTPSSVSASVLGPGLVAECDDDTDCDDGMFCNGEEFCIVESGACRSGSPPCSLPLQCNESTDSCEGAPGCGPCRLFGDFVNAISSPSGAGCVVDVTEIGALLQGFADPDACLHMPQTEIAYEQGCPQSCDVDNDCTLGGVCSSIGQCCLEVEVGDVLAGLDAYAGAFSCPHPCPPGACNFDTNADQTADCCRDGSYMLGGMSESDCFMQGGTYLGDNTTCTLPVCSP